MVSTQNAEAATASPPRASMIKGNRTSHRSHRDPGRQFCFARLEPAIAWYYTDVFSRPAVGGGAEPNDFSHLDRTNVDVTLGPMEGPQVERSDYRLHQTS